MTPTMTRREILKTSALFGTALLWPKAFAGTSEVSEGSIKIGACDWSIEKRGQVEALDTAKEIGLDGVQVSFGPPGDMADLREEKVRADYENACKRTGCVIASLAMGCLNQIPLATAPEAEGYVEDCIDVMKAMGQERVLLAFFGAGDVTEMDKQEKLIKVLKRLAPKAEEAKVILALETWLDAESHLKILDAVASPAVKIYYDVANMETRGYPLYDEIRLLGEKGLICEVHAKENGFLIGKGKVDFQKVRDSLEHIQYKGWLILEGAVPQGVSMMDAYKANLEYLRSLFPSS